MLKQEIRRVLHSPFFYVSIIILVFADFPVMLDQFEMSNELTYLVDVGWGMGYGSVLYPLLCVLTTAESYLMEYRSGYRYSSMSRTSKTRYAVTKMAVAISTGAAIAVLSRLLFLGLTALIVYKIHGQVLVGGEDTIEAMSRTSLLVIQRKYAQYLMLFILEDSLYASILPGIALIVSLFVKNRYVVMLSSYIYCEGMDMIFITLQWYYGSPLVLMSTGRASLLPYKGLPLIEKYKQARAHHNRLGQWNIDFRKHSQPAGSVYPGRLSQAVRYFLKCIFK